jgi:hypothetical protein
MATDEKKHRKIEAEINTLRDDIMAIILEPTNLHWIQSKVSDDPNDLCAHSPVRFEVDGHVLIRPEDGDWAVSATALFLLRSLFEDWRAPNTDIQLFPCCGHGIYDVGETKVLILGCNQGIDFDIQRNQNGYKLIAGKGNTFLVDRNAWVTAVCRFSDAVDAFYVANSEKCPHDDTDKKGYELMRKEWRELREKVTQ